MMSFDIRGKIASYLGDNRFKLIIFSIILFTGSILWMFRILILMGIFDNPHGENIFLGDFRGAYYETLHLFLNDGDVYASGSYSYPPLFIAFLIPFAYLTLDQSCVVMTILNTLLLISSTIIILKILQYYGIFLKNYEKLVLFICIFLFYPVSTSFTAGQINIAVLFSITLFYYYLFNKERNTYASAFLSIATILKIWPAVLVFLSLFQQKAKTLPIKYVSIIGILSAVSILIFGFPMHV
jgi:hypothetical protein